MRNRPEAPGDDRSRPHRIPAWLEMVLLLGTALAVSVVVKTFVVQMFFVPSESMEPLFVKDDRILVEKVSSWTGEVERGDVVVFEDPGDWLGAPPALTAPQQLLSTVGLYPTAGHLVKRVIAVGGDRVRCCDSKGRVTVNGVPLEESDYLREGSVPSTRTFNVKVPADRVWVMGDNRNNSEDSRFHQDLPGKGTVPVDSIVGRVWAVVWPMSRWDRMETPATFDRLDERLAEAGR